MNAKNFKEVTRQVAVIKTQNRTLAIYANLRPVSIESGEDFMTIIDGKFKLDLNDFSNGKGDNAKHVQFNLDIKDIKYLYARAKMFDMPMPYNIIKNYTMPEAIIKDGPDKGKAKTKKIFISRTSVDEKTGKPMRSPWAIQIENGVSRPKNGGRSSVEIEPNLLIRHILIWRNTVILLLRILFQEERKYWTKCKNEEEIHIILFRQRSIYQKVQG